MSRLRKFLHDNKITRRKAERRARRRKQIRQTSNVSPRARRRAEEMTDKDQDPWTTESEITNDGYLIRTTASSQTMKTLIQDLPGRLVCPEEYRFFGRESQAGVGHRDAWVPFEEEPPQGVSDKPPMETYPTHLTVGRFEAPSANISATSIDLLLDDDNTRLLGNPYLGPPNVFGRRGYFPDRNAVRTWVCLNTLGEEVDCEGPDVDRIEPQDFVTTFAPFTQSSGGPSSRRGGWWRARMEYKEAPKDEEIYAPGDPLNRLPIHWLSIATGYTTSADQHEFRLGAEFIDTLAPGYWLHPPAHGGHWPTGFEWDADDGLAFTANVKPSYGTWPTAAVARRRVSGAATDGSGTIGSNDVIAVAVPVASMDHPTAEYLDNDRKTRSMDCGKSALLVMAFLYNRDPDERRFEMAEWFLFKPEELDLEMATPTYQVSEGSPVFRLKNRVHDLSVAIDDNGKVFVHGVWITSTSSSAVDPLGGEEFDALVLRHHMFKATLGLGPIAGQVTFQRLWTSVWTNQTFTTEDSVAPDPMNADSSPGSGLPLPHGIQSWCGADNVVRSVANCIVLSRQNTAAGKGMRTGFPESSAPYVDLANGAMGFFLFSASGFVQSNTITSWGASEHHDYGEGFGSRGDWSIGPYNFSKANTMAFISNNEVIFAGFSVAGNQANTVRFLKLNVDTGAQEFDFLPPLPDTPGSWYDVTPRITCYQQEVKLQTVNGEQVTPFCLIVCLKGYDSELGTLDKTDEFTYTYVWNAGKWRKFPKEMGLEVPSMAGRGGVHYMGNGLFGDMANMFTFIEPDEEL